MFTPYEVWIRLQDLRKYSFLLSDLEKGTLAMRIATGVFFVIVWIILNYTFFKGVRIEAGDMDVYTYNICIRSTTTIITLYDI